MQIVFINGMPRSGKDTFVELAQGVAEKAGIRVVAISSIDPVRNAMRCIGINTEEKTPELRAVMSEIGDTMEKWLSFRSGYCVKNAREFDLQGRHVMFIHMREPDLIEKTASMLQADGYNSVRVYIRSKRAEAVDTNASDTGTWRDDFYHYDFSNDGTFEDLKIRAHTLLEDLKPGLMKHLALT